MNKEITIYFSEEDLQELMRGKVFNWSYKNVDVKLLLGNEDDENSIYDCDKCEDGNNLIKGMECYHCGNDAGVLKNG